MLAFIFKLMAKFVYWQAHLFWQLLGQILVFRKESEIQFHFLCTDFVEQLYIHSQLVLIEIRDKNKSGWNNVLKQRPHSLLSANNKHLKSIDWQ